MTNPVTNLKWKPVYSLWLVPINFSLAFFSADLTSFVLNTVVGVVNLLYFLLMEPV